MLSISSQVHSFHLETKIGFKVALLQLKSIGKDIADGFEAKL